VNFSFSGKRIAGVLTVLPANERSFMDDMKNFDFPEEKSLKLKKVMGYDRHRIVTGETCVSDLAVHGFRHLFDNGLVKPDELDALVVITQSPDYFMPATSNVIQGRLNLKHDMLCMDIAQGCAGFVVGLIQSFMMLEQASINKVALVNADVLSRKVSPKDKNSFPLIGDAACIIHIINRAAASLYLLRHALMAGEPALVPELHGQTHHVVPFSTQHGRNGGGIHTAGHCHGNGLGPGVCLWRHKWSVFIIDGEERWMDIEASGAALPLL
jgi:3-oxoacyl-[acyl-carrier-protein] synthase-3